MLFSRIVESFIAFRRIPLKVVVVTALASYLLQIGAILQGQPLYIIVFFTLVPWVPLVLFEGLWKVKHYNWFAVFAVITVLQIGHLGEHSFQIVQLYGLNGTIACPPPVDNQENADRAIQAGLRPADSKPTGLSSQNVAKGPKADSPIGAVACGVFGQLDFETVHLVWDTAVWIGALALLTRFPGNLWLWVAMGAASLHEIEHLFIGAVYFFETANVFTYKETLFGTVAKGNIVTAYPIGTRETLTNFYEAGGKAGFLAANGWFERVILNTTGMMPIRPLLHFGYNTVVVLPTIFAFLVQVRRVYDEYLAEALPELTEEQLIRTTTQLQPQSFKAGEYIVRQGDPADKFYIITKGSCDVLRQTPTGGELIVNKLAPGQYFGEIGLLHGGKRIASVRASNDVEVLALGRDSFNHLMEESDMSRQEIDRLVRQRVEQVRTVAGGG